MPTVNTNFIWETVGLPLVSGVDLNTRARLVDKLKLLKAENVYYPKNGGPEIRRGHRAVKVEDSAVTHPPPGWLRGIPDVDDNSYGLGLTTETSTQSILRNTVSEFPGAGVIRGLATRDKEILAWDGSRLFTYHSGDQKTSRVQGSSKYQDGTEIVTRAFMPTAKTSVIAKTGYAQKYSDMADNGTIRIVATKNVSDGTIEIFCYDSVNGSLRFKDVLDCPFPEEPRVVGFDSFIHIYVNDTGGTGILQYVIHNTAYEAPAGVAVGTGVGTFDFVKLTNNLLMFAYVNTTLIVVCKFYDETGTVNTTYTTSSFNPDLGGSNVHFVAIAANIYAEQFCLMWRDNTGLRTYSRVYSLRGVADGARHTVSTNADVKHITCTSANMPLNHQQLHGNTSAYFLFEDALVSGNYQVYSEIYYGGSSSFSGNTRYNVHLASKAFTVGSTGFVYVCYPTTLQTQYLLVDHRLVLAGRLEYGTAISEVSTEWLPTVNFTYSSTPWKTYNFHCALMYRVRITTQNTPTPTIDAVFQEQSTKFVEMNFLPNLSSAQMGRSTYFAGALLWMYDGKELTEANFIAGPESFTMSSPVSGTAPHTAGDKYRYRVYLVHKNAQGEEVRSLAFLSDEYTVGVNNTLLVTGNTIPTNKPDTYFLVYRNEKNTGTLWYLVSSRDPSSASCPKNDQSAATWTFEDTVTDTILIDNELDPANTTTWIQPWCAPSCELISFGKDRLWISGGEIPHGEVWVSRLDAGNQVPGFSPVLTVTVDKSADPITAIGFVSDYALLFKRSATYILGGQFSGNTFTGNQISTQLALSEIGAVSNHTARVSQGCVFQSEGGFRLITSGGELKYIGSEVDSLSGTLTGMVVCSSDRNIRMYQSDNNSPVMDYESGEWSVFTLKPTAAITNPVTGFAVLAINNKLYFEEEDLYTDDGKLYNATIRSAWLGSGLGTFQRVRRVGAIGEFYGHSKARVNIYMDEATGWTETFTWDTEDDLNTSTWGGGTWGSGFWGDSGNTTHFAAKDSVWRWRRRLNRQKCSAISVEIIVSSRYGKAVVPTAIMLEIGNKNSMDKIPSRTFGV